MYIGIDLGTSGVKAILLSEQGDVLATQTEKLQVSRPHPLWSEQDPEQWWQATDSAIKALGERHSLREVKAIGIAGQMHGVTPGYSLERRPLRGRVRNARRPCAHVS